MPRAPSSTGSQAARVSQDQLPSPSPSPAKRKSSSSTPTRKPRQPRKGKVTPGASGPQTSTSGTENAPSLQDLLSKSSLTTDEWYKAVRTKSGYANYVKNGKLLLAEWTSSDSEDQRRDLPQIPLTTTGDSQNNPTGEQVQNFRDDADFAQAFDKLSGYTPLALKLVTAYKCEHENRAFSTAEGLRSAFKHYFERVLGCQGDNCWRYNPYTSTWEGNPVFDADYKAYYESLKNRNRRTNVTTQALPMLPKDLKIIFDYLDSTEGMQKFDLTKRLYFKAFASTAFNLWTRNDELINLQMCDVTYMPASADLCSHFVFQLVFRKTNKDPLKGQAYQIPPDPDNPELDCYSHMLRWLEHMNSLISRGLMKDDFIFPAIAATGKLKFGEAMSRPGFESLLEDIVEASGVAKGRNGKFTTHCFRRGGAQYRFMWAKKKWSLKAVKWWGGWSSNDRVGTVMRYLLDELTAYEDGFGDILMPERNPERHETFMADADPKAPVAREDLDALSKQLTQGFTKIYTFLQESRYAEAFSSAATMSSLISHSSPAEPNLHAAPSAPSTSSRMLANLSLQTPQRPHEKSTSSLSAVATTLFHAPTTNPASKSSPHPCRIPEVHTLDDVIQYWIHGAPEKGLVIPLNDWADTFSSKDYTGSEAVKLGNIRSIWEEYSVQCGSNMTLFEEQYPGLRTQYTKLLKAVRQARIDRGDAKPRKRRK